MSGPCKTSPALHRGKPVQSPMHTKLAPHFQLDSRNLSICTMDPSVANGTALETPENEELNYDSQLKIQSAATSKDVKALLPALIDCFRSSEYNLNEIVFKMKKNFIRICQENSMKIHSLEGEVGLLKNKLEKYEEKSDDMEAYNRKEAVIISGTAVPVASTNEDCKPLVVRLFRDELQSSASTEKLVTAHRLGSPPSAGYQDKTTNYCQVMQPLGQK